MLPHEFPPWAAVYQQTRRWLDAGVFDELTEDLRVLLRQAHGRAAEPTACILDSRTLQSTPEPGARAGHDAGKRRKGSKLHLVDTLGYPLSMHTSAANEQERARVASLLEKVQDVTGCNVEMAYADQGHSGEDTQHAVSFNASKCNACIALQRIAGMPGGLIFPFFFGIITL